MKKIIFILIAAIFISVFSLTVVAADETPEAPVEESKLDTVVSAVTNSAFWVTTGTVLTAVIGCLAVFKSKFGSLAALISKNADAKTISKALKETSSELSEAFNSELTKLDEKLSQIQNNEKTLTTILSLFIMNANINQNAKAEIMQYISGIKDTSGKIIDIVENADKIIAEANAAETTEPTPALDKIIAELPDAEKKSEMVLG